MAISTIDQAIAGMQPPVLLSKAGAAMKAAGVLHSLFFTPGAPGAAAVPSPGIAGAALTTFAGQIPFTNPVAGNSYLARLAASASTPGMLLLADRLWHNSGIAVATTTPQTVNSVAFPARDSNGSVNGANVLVGIEVSAATTNAGAVTNMTLGYTNSAGTAGQTGTIPSTVPGGGFPATANAGTFMPFQLAAGDVGVRSIQSVTLGTSLVSGTVALVAYRVLAALPVAIANVGYALDVVSGGFPRMFDNSVPFLLWMPTATTAITLTGTSGVTQG